MYTALASCMQAAFLVCLHFEQTEKVPFEPGVRKEGVIGVARKRKMWEGMNGRVGEEL